ncbi:hypothetical protein ACO0QE_002908 [Hanseniaspora vineae]
MSSFRRHNFSIRGECLKKLTQLSLKQDSATGEAVDDPVPYWKATTDQLSVSYTTDRSKVYTIPLTLNELEILFAVCSSVPETEDQATSLIDNVISHYFTTCTKQQFNDICKNKFKDVHNVRPDGRSVYECLTYNLCTFLIRCYAKYKNLQPRIEAMFLESFTNYQFTTYSLCSLLGLLNAFIKTATDDAPSQLHDVVLRQFWDWNFSDGHFDARFHELITNVLQNENYDDTLMSYFDLNYELSSFMFGERIAALQILILKSKFSFSDDYSFIEHILRLKKCESSNENGTAKFDSFLETIKKHGSFLSDCLKFSLETLDYLQHKSMDLSTFSKVEFAFMNKDCCLQVSSLLLFMTDDVKTDLNIARVVDIILEFMRAYTDDSYLFYEGFLVSIMVFASLLNYYTEQLTTELLNMFPIFISNKFVSNDLVVRISKNFSLGLPPLTEDAVVSSVYDITNLLGENSMAHLASLNQRKAVVDDSINSKFLRNFHEQPTFDGLSLDEPSGNATTKKKTPYQEKFGLKKRANTLTTLQSMNIFKNFAEKNMLDNLSIQSVDGSASVSNGATAQRDDASDETAELFKKMTLDTKDDEKNDKWKFWNNVVTALVHVASLYNDQSINVLTITILTQKFGTVSETLDSIILHKLPILVNQVGETEFQLLLKFIQYHEKNAKTKAGITSCMESRCEISKVLHQLGPKHPLYMIYLKDLLENIVAEGENQASETLSLVDYDGRSVSQKDGLARPELQKLASSYRSTRSRGHQHQHTAKTEHEVMSSGGRIMVYLKPVSLLLPGLNERKINYQKDLDETLVNLFRNSWFNMVIHGFYYPFPQLDRRLVSKSSTAHGSLSTMSGMRDKYLQVFAYNSPPLASNYPKSTRETSFEMNTILRRDTSESNLKLQNSVIHHFYKLENPLISNNSVSNQVKTLFLSSSIMLELYRCDSLSDESVSSCILYLTDPQVKSHFSKFFQNFSLELVKWVSKKAKLTKNAASRIPFDLQKMLICTSSRDVDVQKQSFECCNSFIQHCPDILIRNETSIFTMLGLLSVVFKSCVDMKQTTMSPPFQYTIHTGDTHTETIFLPMNDTWRIQTLQLMEQFYSKWISKSFKYYQDDIEILLQKFISLKTKRGNNAGRVSGHADFYADEIDYAVSFAMTHATGISTREKPILKTVFPPRAYHPSTGTSVTRFDSAYKFLSKQSWSSSFWSDNMGFFSRDEIVKTRELMVRDGLHLSQDLIEYLNLTSTLLCIGGSDHQDPQDGGLRLIRELFEVSMLELSNSSIDFEQQMDSLSVIKHSVDIWANVMREKTGFKNLFLSEFIHCWSLAFPGGFESCMGSSFPVFSKKFDIVGSEYNEMEYKPSGTEQIQHRDRITMAHFEKMHHVLQFWCQFIKKEYSGGSSNGLDATVHVFLSLIASPKVFATLSTHPFSLKIRLDILEILLICIEKLQGDFTQLTQLCNWLVYDGCLWFSLPNGQGSVYGENEIEMIFCVEQLQKIQTKLAYCFNKIAKFVDPLLGDASSSKNQVIILQKMIALEIKNLRDWMSLDNSGGVMSIELGDSGANNTDITESLVKTSFAMDCGLCLQLLVRFRLGEKFGALVTRLLVTMPHVTDSVLQNGDLILAYLLSSGASKDVSRFLYRNMVFFKPIAPIQSINIFKMLAEGGSTKSLNNVILQFNLKSLEYHDSRVVFFYIPQIVQCLRYDPLGYVEKFIIDTGKVNMYFQHQIIWNMLANMYKDDEGVVPDEVLKPLLDKLYNKILNNFTVREREFYDLEFGFFNEVTAISGKLKPFIKKSKMEKKLKIDQEMALIEIKPRVYLPSHPDGTVVDIDRLSGKPLQSHAKAPFMATFLIRGVASTEKSTTETSTTETSTTETSTTETNEGTSTEITSSTPRSVFQYPLANRDMLGREAVNGLYEWFVNKFGDENSMDFEIARLNFIKSLAGYSVISYLLQFKDRHNGNIMYDDMGHILHIDFGFIFDIVPGGVKFEAVPFKLTKEMVKILGGSKNSKYFLLFEKLCCQAFLQLRWQHEFIIKCIEPMLDSGLPCFKANKTIKNLKNRFVLGKDDLQAAQYMKHLINKSYESVYTKGYDEFQKLTNGIPY